MIRLSKHAEEAIDTRKIELDWIETTVNSPDFTAPDPRHPERTRSFKAIADFGGRVLRVVHRADGDDIDIVTVYFDREHRR